MRFHLHSHHLQSRSPPRTSFANLGCTDPLFRALERPLLLRGEVIKGFGRGSASLGTPTANLDAAALADKLVGVEPGVYVGWASVNGGPVYKTVMSIG